MRAFIILAVCFAYGNADGLSQKGINLGPQAEAGGPSGPGGVGPGGVGPGGVGPVGPGLGEGVGVGPGDGVGNEVGPGVGGAPGRAPGLGGPGVGGVGGVSPAGGDLFMLLIQQTIQVNGMDPMRIPNQQLPFQKKFLLKNYRGTLFTYGTVMFGLHNLRRTGPCFVTVDNTGMRLGLNLGISHVFVNSSATIKFHTGEKHKILVQSYVRNVRAVLEIAQVSPTLIKVTNFRIKKLVGFELRLRPIGQVPRAFRAFLKAVQTFVEITVKRRLEPLVRDAINVQIKRLLYELSEQARHKPRPTDVLGLPPASRDDISGGPESNALPEANVGQNKL
ncbi:uncharacterized protein LOC144169166 isoform X2 [Haemaphysalis longicornis]